MRTVRHLASPTFPGVEIEVENTAMENQNRKTMCSMLTLSKGFLENKRSTTTIAQNITATNFAGFVPQV